MAKKLITEADWLSATNPMAMLQWLHKHATLTDRKQRLLSCAFCRCIWYLLPNEGQRAVDVAERFADGLVPANVLKEAGIAAGQATRALADSESQAQQTAADAAWRLTRQNVSSGVADVPALVIYAAQCDAKRARRATRDDEVDDEITTAMRKLPRQAAGPLCAAVLELMGNVFRPAMIQPSWLRWRDGTVPKIAQAIYDDRAFADLPILADALEEAGCDNADILAHCRSGGEHVRGCWVIDLILGKS